MSRYEYVASLLETKARLDELERRLERVVSALEELVEAYKTAPPPLPGQVSLPAYHYAFYIDALFRWLEHAGVIVPTIVEVPITVTAGQSGYGDLWLPTGIACVERVFEIHFPTSRGIKYGWKVDSTTEWTVPMHYFIPNKGYVEESVFGKYWIKWYFLRFHFEAIDSGTIVIRAWARLIDHKKLDKLLEIAAPLAEMFEVTYPPPRATPAVGGSRLIKECPICHAKLYEEDGKLIRVGSWGTCYSSHKCEVFS